MAQPPLTIFLVRHGESTANRDGFIQGQTDSPLSQVGLAQARCIQDRFAAGPVSAVYSSPLERCRTVAELLLKGRSVPLVFLDGLMEAALGEWELLPVGEANRRVEAEAQEIWSDPWSAPPGGESPVAVWERSHAAWQRILGESQGAVVVVTHGGIIRQLLGALVGLPRETTWRDYPFLVENGSISQVEIPTPSWLRSGGPIIRSINDTCHLGRLQGA